MSINHYDTNNYSQDESTRYFYGTYPGRKSDLALMMNSHDVELQHSDSGQLRGILRNKHEGQTSRPFFQEYDTTVVSTVCLENWTFINTFLDHQNFTLWQNL